MIKKIKPVLTKGGISIKYSPNCYKYIKKIIKLFTIEFYGFNDEIRIARAYKLYKKYNLLVVPKFGFLKFLNDPDTKKPFNKIGIYHEDGIVNKLYEREITFKKKFKWSGKSNSYQKVVIKNVMENYFSEDKLESGFAGVILNLPTGHGKTYVAMGLIDKIRTTTLYICPTRKIANQVYKIMIKMFPELKIGIYHSDMKVYGNIIIGVIDSFSKSKKFIFIEKTNEHAVLASGKLSKRFITNRSTYSPKEFFEIWDLIIFDECHNYCTEKNSNIFSRMSPRYTLGLSATPDNRQDSFDILCQWNIGPILNINNIPNYLDIYIKDGDIPTFKGNVLGIKYHGPKNYTYNILDRKGAMIPYKMLEQLTDDPYRIELIIFIISLLNKKDYCILIFADRISYLRTLKEKLEKYNLCDKATILDDIPKKKKKVIQVTGGASDHDMNIAYTSANIIFTTYPFFKEGISIPRINSIIYATPKRYGYEQTNGRCIRPSILKNKENKKKENDKVRIIVDIIDWDVRIQSQWFTRKKAHKKMNDIGAKFKIKIFDINFDELSNENFSSKFQDFDLYIKD